MKNTSSSPLSCFLSLFDLLFKNLMNTLNMNCILPVCLIVIILSLNNCETVVDVNIKPEPPRLTLNCAFTSDSIWQASLTLSHNILDETPFPVVKNAKIIVFREDSPYDTLVYDQDNGIYSSASDKKPEQNQLYKIKVQVDDHEIAAQSILPNAVPLTKVEVKHEAGAPNDGFFSENDSYTIEVTFQDNPFSADYYELILFQRRTGYTQTRDTIILYNAIDTYTNDEAFKSAIDQSLIINDNLFNGKEVTIKVKGRFLHYPITGRDVKAFLHFRVLSPELYHYRITSIVQETNSGDPFSQPVHVYTNIENGYGIFGGFQEKVYELKE
jgi:hypothetical protein